MAERILTIRDFIADYEIEHLIEWHRDEQYKCAQGEDYSSAESHKRRAESLHEIVATRTKT